MGFPAEELRLGLGWSGERPSRRLSEMAERPGEESRLAFSVNPGARGSYLCASTPEQQFARFPPYVCLSRARSSVPAPDASPVSELFVAEHCGVGKAIC